MSVVLISSGCGYTISQREISHCCLVSSQKTSYSWYCTKGKSKALKTFFNLVRVALNLSSPSELPPCESDLIATWLKPLELNGSKSLQPGSEIWSNACEPEESPPLQQQIKGPRLSDEKSLIQDNIENLWPCCVYLQYESHKPTAYNWPLCFKCGFM